MCPSPLPLPPPRPIRPGDEAANIGLEVEWISVSSKSKMSVLGLWNGVCFLAAGVDESVSEDDVGESEAGRRRRVWEDGWRSSTGPSGLPSSLDRVGGRVSAVSGAGAVEGGGRSANVGVDGVCGRGEAAEVKLIGGGTSAMGD